MPTAQISEIVAARVRSVAAEKRITIRALAAMTGIGYSALIRRARGEVDFAAGELIVVAKALGVDPAALLPAPVAQDAVA